MRFTQTLFAALLVLSAQAAVVKRSLPTGTVTCGSNEYTASELTAAINAGLEDMNSNNLQGKSKCKSKV